MAKRFKTERASQQQRLICRALLELMEEHQYAEITVSAICQQARIPRRTFYYYYEGKGEVLDGILEEIVTEAELESMFSGSDNRDEVEESFARFFRYWQEKRSAELSALVRNDLGQLLVNRSMQWLQEDPVWSRFIGRAGEYKKTIASMVGMTCVFYTLFYWHRGGFAQQAEHVAKYVTDLLTSPLYPTN